MEGRPDGWTVAYRRLPDVNIRPTTEEILTTPIPLPDVGFLDGRPGLGREGAFKLGEVVMLRRLLDALGVCRQLVSAVRKAVEFVSGRKHGNCNNRFLLQNETNTPKR